MREDTGMSKPWISLALTALMAGGLFFHRPASATAGALLANPAFSVESLIQNEDLDVRDEHNHRITDSSARENLRQLFVSTLFTLLLDSELPLRAQARERLETACQLLKHRLHAAVQFFSHSLPYAAIRSLRKLQKAAWACLAWLSAWALTFVVLSSSLQSHPLRKANPLILRC